MTRVAVSEPVLRWALERSGRLSAVKRKFPKLGEWERGQSQPTLRQLESLSKATSTPLGYFFLPEPPEDQLPIPYFRTTPETRPRQPSADLLETVQTMERRQAWMREELVEQGQGRLAFVSSTRITENLLRLSHRMRESLGLAQGWAAAHSTWTDTLRDLQSRMETIGIVVVVSGIVGNNTRRKLDVNEFRGFVLVDEYVPFVFVNGADGKAAQMFTLAHELAHIWLGSSAAFDLRDMQPADDETERACNRVAAEFLVPEDELRRFWPSANREQEPFEAAAREFKVSALVAARRALDLALIPQKQFWKFFHAYEADERRRAARQREGGDFYASQNLRLGRRFAETVVRAAREGRLLYHEAYRLTGLYGRTFEQYAESLRLGGPP